MLRPEFFHSGAVAVSLSGICWDSFHKLAWWDWISSLAQLVWRSSEQQKAGLSIEYRVADLNVFELERDSFDVVFASGALHHIHELERLLLQVRDCLSTNGFLIASEYVGPNQLQWTDSQVRAINDILELLPSRYKRRISASTEFKLSFLGPSSIEEMNRADPTEAVHSEDIVPLVRNIFRMVEFKPIGGTILHMMLQDIIGNFQPGNDADDCILRLICQLEWNLISSGQLGSDFAYFVARPVTDREAPLK